MDEYHDDMNYSVHEWEESERERENKILKY